MSFIYLCFVVGPHIWKDQELRRSGFRVRNNKTTLLCVQTHDYSREAVCVCVCVCVCTHARAQSCLTHCSPMDCSPLDSSVHGILQARILELEAYFFSRISSWPRGWTLISRVSFTGRQIVYHHATREDPEAVGTRKTKSTESQFK